MLSGNKSIKEIKVHRRFDDEYSLYIGVNDVFCSATVLRNILTTHS